METVKMFKLNRPFDECARFALCYCPILRCVSLKSNGEIDYIGYKSNLFYYYLLIIFVPCTLQVTKIGIGIMQSVSVPVRIYI